MPYSLVAESPSLSIMAGVLPDRGPRVLDGEDRCGSECRVDGVTEGEGGEAGF